MFVFLLSMTAQCVGAERKPIEFGGSLDSFAQAVVDRLARPQVSQFALTLDSEWNIRGPIFVNVANSRTGVGVIYRDNCVATPFDNDIYCNLKLVDDL